jgi:chromosome segregation ATPase
LLEQLRDAESAIKAVEAKIVETEIELKAAQDPTDKKFLRSELAQLRSKEQQLRSKEQFLLSEQQRLRSKDHELRAEAKQFPRAGTVQYPGAQTVEIGLSQGVWSIMSQEVQERVLQLLDAKKTLGAVNALHHMRSELSVSDAAKFGIEVLHARDGMVQLGYFDVPAILAFLQSPPKGA